MKRYLKLAVLSLSLFSSLAVVMTEAQARRGGWTNTGGLAYFR